MISVFLSHASKDKLFVREMADALEAGGEIRAWLDEREINYGENIVLKLTEGLDADFVLLILSPDSVESKWVKEEWSAAFWQQVESKRVTLAGVLYRECRMPGLLANKKYFDLQRNQPEGFREIRSWLLGQRPPPRPVVHLPQRRPMVIGREPEIEEIRRRLKEPGSLAYVSGLAGRGKTTLALEYAHRYQRDFEAVHWLPCEGRSLTQIAGELMWQLGIKLEGELEATLHELNGHCARKRCLLIFDNLEGEAAARLMPAGSTSVLITTRLKNLRFLRGHLPLDLPLFSEEQCFELFGRIIGEEEIERHAIAAHELFQRVGYLPLAIAVAAGLIREDVRYTIEDMARNLPVDVYALLQQAVVSLSAPAQVLLMSMAACAPEGFRLALAAEVADIDEHSSLDALQEIHARSLVEELDRTTRRYRLHALVREASGISDVQRLRHAECLEKEFQAWENQWRQCAEDMADWQLALSWSLQICDLSQTVSLANHLASKGFALTYRLGRLTEAYETAIRMGQVAEFHEDKLSLQVWYGNQAVILRAWGRLEEAMALHKKEEAVCLESDNQYGLQGSYGSQALILQSWGRLEEAMALHKKEEAICLDLGDPDGLQRSYGNQALILQDWGRLEEAMALHKKEEAICLELDNQYGLQELREPGSYPENLGPPGGGNGTAYEAGSHLSAAGHS